MKTVRRSIPVLAMVLLALSGANCNKLKSRDQLNKGVANFRNAQYTDAVENFKTAVDLDPNYVTARQYLAVAYFQQYVPGAESPENRQIWQAAYDQFQRVVDQDPKNTLAIGYIASLYFNRKDWPNAQRWYEKLISIEPSNKEAYYNLAVITYWEWYPEYNKARQALNMKQDDPGPFKDKKVREDLAARFGPMIDVAQKNLDKCLQLDPEYDDAMTYKNLLIRERADLADNKDDYAAQVKTADEWFNKALATLKIKADRKAKKTGGGIVADTSTN
jgi:tetratricopeptide (TPR) repeat protein